MKRQIYLPLLAMLLASMQVSGQSKSVLYENYIKKYSDIAVEEMKRYKIPASITLAQALLESSAGQSRLATEANNHFGIKCGGDWSGSYISHDDDKKDDCFRKYASASSSFEDHSKFLVNRPWYQGLFKLKLTDYKGWAHGLKKAGYATDNKYPDKLIDIIEKYGLSKYDKLVDSPSPVKVAVDNHQIYTTNGVPLIIVRQGDTFEGLAKELGLKKNNIIAYNDLLDNYLLQPGDIIYLKKKKNKASKEFKVHIVAANESLHDISQHYAIDMKELYRKNKSAIEKGLRVGDIIQLR